MWDDDLDRYIGVEGVKVRARRWFTTHTGIANSNGNYSCNGRFRKDANYSIVWERHDFEIRKSWLGRAKCDGPKRTGNWDLQINEQTVKILGRTVIVRSQKFYATIFRAAHHYYYKDIQGLRRPPQNSFWKTQLKIRAFDEENDDSNGNHAAWRRFLGLGSAVKIYNPQHNSREIYATVIHELAHASHWNMKPGDFNNTETIVKESWARGVQWKLTQMVYPDYRGGGTRLPYYTQLVIDMIDTRGDDFRNNGTNHPNDQVTGYTIKQIEDALKGKKTWDSWKENIKNNYNNETEDNLDTLFDFWN